jgi:hypothetical protein
LRLQTVRQPRQLARARRWIADELGYRPFLVLLAMGVAVRVGLTATYFPAVMESFDSPRFARAGPTGLFDDFWMPAGYPAFLEAARVVTDQLWVTIGLQHLIGLGVGVLLFLTTRRLGAGPAPACVPAAVVFLSGDQLYLEHIIMADVLLIALTAAALAAAVFGLVPRVRPAWLAVAGALAVGAMLCRSVGVVVVLSIALVAFVWGGRAWRPRGVAAGAVVVGALAVLALYVGAYHAADGRYLGLTDMRGWNLYGRAATFADCSEFTPPPGTRGLCETVPTDQRPGPFGYVWVDTSIARRQFTPLGPDSGRSPGRFAERAILGQPLDYAKAVLVDLVRYVEPTAGPPRGYSGQSNDLVSFGFRDVTVERVVTDGLSKRYSGTKLRISELGTIESYQKLFRVERLLLAFFVAATLAGFWVTRGPLRLGCFLFGLTALGLYVLPVLTISYDFRYGIAGQAFIVTAGTLGAAGMWQRFSGRR